jgi:hypothetical protein
MQARRFSRWMELEPLATPLSDAWAALVCGLVTLALIALVVRLPENPLAAVWVAGFLAYVVVVGRREKRRMQLLAVSRLGEDIGTFARAFNRRGAAVFDPRAVRGVWHTLQRLQPLAPEQVPIRPSDRLHEDLAIDDEDLAYTLPDLVKRCGREFGAFTDENLAPPSVATVADVVFWIGAHRVRDS